MVGLTDCVRDKMQSRNKGFARSTVLSTDSKSTRTAVESTRTLAHDQGEREVLCRTQEIDDWMFGNSVDFAVGRYDPHHNG